MDFQPLRKELLKHYYREIEKLESGEITSIKLVSESKYIDDIGDKKTRKTISYFSVVDWSLRGFIP